MDARGSLQSLYAGTKKVFSLEFFPPKTSEGLQSAKAVIAQCAQLHIDYMTVTYGAGGSTRHLTDELLLYIHETLKKPVVSHLTCVGQSSEEITQRLEFLKQHGITKILALRGDPPQGAAQFQPHPEGFSCARDLIKHIEGHNGFAVAAAGYPEVHREARSRDADIRYLKEKVDAGAEIILTQLFFDPRFYFEFVADARKAGIMVPIVPGIMPIRDASQVKRFTQLCGATIPQPILNTLEKIKHDKDAVIAYGSEQAHTLCVELLEGGAPGIHFYTLNKSNQVRQLVQSLA